MADEKKPFNDKVKDWLINTGFPLEMRVAQIFTEAKFSVSMSEYYRDFDTNKPREIDVVARIIRSEKAQREGTLAGLLIYAYVECKASTKYPWVVLKGPRKKHWLRDTVMCTKRARLVLPPGTHKIETNLISQNAFRAGTGITKAFRQQSDGDHDNAHEALFQAFKAAEAEVAENFEDNRTAEYATRHRYLQPIIAFPIVVISAPLFECTLETSGEMTVAEVQYSSVVFNYPQNTVIEKRYGSANKTVIHIVHESALPIFVESITEFADIMKANLGTMTLDKFDEIHKLTE